MDVLGGTMLLKWCGGCIQCLAWLIAVAVVLVVVVAEVLEGPMLLKCVDEWPRARCACF